MTRRLVLRLERPAVSLRFDARALGVLGGLVLATLAVAMVGVSVGDYPVGPLAAVEAIFGDGSAAAEFVVVSIRLPRVLAAILVGASLGLSGAIFQAFARNPLVAPDIIGINAGAALAGVAVILYGGPLALLAPLAFAGALVTAFVVYGLSWRRGLSSYRLVLVGIGVNAMLSAGIAFMVTRGNVYEVARAYRWLVGSLHGAGWTDVVVLAIVVAILLPTALAIAPRLHVLQLGDDVARGLGVPLERVRLGLVLIGVALAAFAVAVAGPVGFVAFIAPHIGRRLARTSGAAVLPIAAASGAILVLAADVVAQRLFAPTSLPVGILTAILGAPYFLYLLYRSNRTGAAV